MTDSAGERLRGALSAWCDLVRRGAIVVVLAAVALTAAALSYTLDTLTIDTSTQGMIAPDVPFRRHSQAFADAFPQLRRNIVAVIDAPTPERAERAAKDLATRLSGGNPHFTGVYVPGAEPFFETNAFLYLGIEELNRLADRLAAAEPLLATLAEDPSLRGLAEVLDQALERGDSGALQELAPLLDRMAEVTEAAAEGRPRRLSWQTLLAGDEGGRAAATRRFVITEPDLDEGALAPAGPAIREIRRQAADLALGPGSGVRLRLTGQPVLQHEELESVRLGGSTAAGLSLTLVLVLLVVALRSWRLVLATAATLVMGLVWTAAFAALAIGHLNLISVAFAVLFVGLAVDFGIHLSLRYREELGHDAEHAGALSRAGAAVGGALALSALAAAAGFYAFLPTDFLGLAELGLISGSGMFIALVANLTVLPALLAMLPLRAKHSAVSSGVASVTDRLAQRHRQVLSGALALAAASLVALPFVRFDFNPINLKDPRDESVATFLDLARDPDTSPYAVDVLAQSLDEAGSKARRLAALDEVERAVTAADYVPARQEWKLAVIDDMATFLAPALMLPARPPPAPADRVDAFERLRQSAHEAAARGGALGEAAGRLDQALAALDDRALSAATLEDLEARYTAYLPAALERLRAALSAQPVGLEALPAELRRRWFTQDGRTRVEAFPQAAIDSNSELERFADAVLRVTPTATGTPIVVTQASKEVVAAFVHASVLAFVLVVALLLVVLRRLSDVLLVLGPLLLAALLTAAGAVVFAIPFNFANVIVLPLLFGLGVASGIHLVLRRREEGSGGRVLRSSTPRAVLFSALTTLASFGSLAVSGHRGMNSMGELLTVAIVCTLFAMLVVLPALMTAFGETPSRRARA